MTPPDGKIHAITGGAAAPLALRRASEFKGLTPPEREWHVPNLVPAANVTLLYGDGGTGKSLLALQLAASTVLGRQWIGLGATQGPAVFFSAEDEMPELHRRLDSICEAEGVDFDALDNLHLVSLADEDALLAAFNPKLRQMQPTARFHALDVAMAEIRPALLVLDTLADLHDGDEILKAHARQVIGLFRRLAIRHRCAVVVLAHPSLSGMADKSGRSGNVAWSNSARSRLYLHRITENGHEADRDARELSDRKVNYGPGGFRRGLKWRHGVFVADRAETGLERAATGAKADRVFLKMLRLFAEQNRNVSSSPGPTFAPTQFAGHDDVENIGKENLRTAMERLLAMKVIEVAEKGPRSKRRKYLREVME